MRKAYYMGEGPPIDWFITASLLYDKVKLPIKFYEMDVSFYAALPAHIAIAPEFVDLHRYYHDICNNPKVDFLEDQPLDVAVDWTPNPQIFLSRIKASNPGLDLFWPEAMATNVKASPLVLQPLQALLPSDPTKIEISQLVDFRAENELRRTKFQIVADDFIKSLGAADSEEDALRIIRLAGMELQDQQKKLIDIYQRTKIPSALQSMGIFCIPQGLIAWFGPMCHVAGVDADGLIAFAALSVVPWLVARQDSDAKVNDSPWAYLWHLNKLVK